MTANLAYTEVNIDIFKICSGIPARRFTLEYLSLMPQNVQDLDVGQLELFLRCLNFEICTMFTKWKSGMIVFH